MHGQNKERKKNQNEINNTKYFSKSKKKKSVNIFKTLFHFQFLNILSSHTNCKPSSEKVLSNN